MFASIAKKTAAATMISVPIISYKFWKGWNSVGLIKAQQIWQGQFWLSYPKVAHPKYLKGI
jgi:hypothetical protein